MELELELEIAQANSEAMDSFLKLQHRVDAMIKPKPKQLPDEASYYRSISPLQVQSE